MNGMTLKQLSSFDCEPRGKQQSFLVAVEL